MTTTRLMRLIATLTAFTVGMLVGAGVSWALTAIVLTCLGLAIAVSVALVRMEEDRDQWRDAANLKHFEPWQVAYIDHLMDPDWKATYLIRPKRYGHTPLADLGAALREGMRPTGPGDRWRITQDLRIDTSSDHMDGRS